MTHVVPVKSTNWFREKDRATLTECLPYATLKRTCVLIEQPAESTHMLTQISPINQASDENLASNRLLRHASRRQGVALCPNHQPGSAVRRLGARPPDIVLCYISKLPPLSPRRQVPTIRRPLTPHASRLTHHSSRITHHPSRFTPHGSRTICIHCILCTQCI